MMIKKHASRVRFDWSKWGLLVAVLVMAATPALPGIARGEEGGGEQLPDKFMIRGGVAQIFGTNANVAFPGSSGIGTSVDLNKTLGGDTSWKSWRIDSLYRFNDRHSVGFSYYRISLSGQTQLNEQITINDQTIAIGATTNTSLNLHLYRLIYDYSFYRNDKVELAVSPGLYMANTKFNFAAQGTINGVPAASTVLTENLTLPLPSVGGIVNYQITPRLKSNIRGDFFYVNAGNFTGSMFEFYAGLEYRVFKNFALGAAYDRLAVDVKDSSKSGYQVNLDYNMIYVFGTLYLF